MSQLRLYNTLTRSKVDFRPIDPANVRMYVCGPTVYDYAHIGNARPVIVFDVLFRLLRHLYGEKAVTYVRNITDVDDKINARAATEYPGLPLNEAIREVTTRTEKQFQSDVTALGCLPPTYQPRATEHIDEMKAIIETLVAKGFAYAAEGHVLFSPAAMDAAGGVLPRYGKLANRSLDEMIAGARVDVAPYKKDSTDFVLWKPSKPGEPGWPAPCGIEGLGRPGWHIECSAMSWKRLITDFAGKIKCEPADKDVFDIHGGGIDLVFPHHENEIAQSCCAFNSSRMANVWMHNGFLQVEGEKMSKSLGNFVTINELLATEKFGDRKWTGEVLRLAMLRTHYRQPIDWTIKALEESRKTLLNWFEVCVDSCVETSINPPDEFVAALADDLNTAKAISALHGMAGRKEHRELRSSLEFMGFDVDPNSVGRLLPPITAYANQTLEAATQTATATLGSSIDALIAARLAAREARDWKESDRIRDELAAMGIQLKDAKDPATGKMTTTWEVKR